MPRQEVGRNKVSGLSGINHTKFAKLNEINEACEKALRQLVSTYPDMEISTFPQQKEEAIKYLQDNHYDATMLKQIAQNRGISVSDLANRVMVKTELFAQASGAIIGKRQQLEDQLDQCSTIDKVNKIIVSF